MNNFKIDFIGVGAQKCGTTWIYRCLTEHPQVCDLAVKEIEFFNKKSTIFQPQKEWRYKKRIDWYKQCFKNCPQGKLKGEWSPHYLVDKDVPFLIKKHFPEVKILACLRNPIQRAYSQYFHVLGQSRDNSGLGSFEKALEQYPEFIEKGFYYKQLKDYFDCFSKENILILIYEDIAKNPLKFIQSLYRFLGIDPSFAPKTVHKQISSKQAKTSRFNRVLRTSLIPVLKKSALCRKIIYSQKARNMFYYLAERPFSKKTLPDIHPQTKTRLRDIFQSDIQNLEKLLNRDLTFWYENNTSK